MAGHEQRRKRFDERLDELGVGLVFLPVSGDLEYLTGFPRRVPTFGNVEYAHNWVTGCFYAPGREPVFVLPRMVRAFDAAPGEVGEERLVSELDDGRAIFEEVARSFGSPARLGVGSRTWAETVLALRSALPGAELVDAGPAVNSLRRVKDESELALMTRACEIAVEAMAEVTPAVVDGVPELGIARDVDYLMREKGSRTPSFDTGVWSMGPGLERDASERVSDRLVRPGRSVCFDFGAVVNGYCSDFGRTICVGEPTPRYLEAYELVMAAQAAGIAAVRPGVTAAEVDAACRSVIADAGYGAHFRHRTGHCIGLDVHEHPFISEEDETPLEAGMTFTIEPSIFWDGEVGVRVEDVVLCTESGGRRLAEYPTTMVVNA